MPPNPQGPAFTLFTLNYTRFRESMGVPVQTSNGRPRYPLRYELSLSVKEVMPPWSLVQKSKKGDMPEWEFRTAYQEHLDSVGVETLASRFRAVAVAGGDTRLVLLCFEDIAKEGWWCHRTMFAEWWMRETNDPVRELGPTGPPDAGPTLFD